SRSPARPTLRRAPDRGGRNGKPRARSTPAPRWGPRARPDEPAARRSLAILPAGYLGVGQVAGAATAAGCPVAAAVLPEPAREHLQSLGRTTGETRPPRAMARSSSFSAGSSFLVRWTRRRASRQA